MHPGFWWGSLSERDHLEDLGVDGKIFLKWIFKKWGGGHGFFWLRIGTGSCECGKLLEIIDQLGNC